MKKMGTGSIAHWSLLLHLLLFMSANGSTEDNLLRLPNTDHNQHTHTQNPSISHMNHIDPLTLVFFTIKDLKVGTKMPISFPIRDPSNSPHFLPRDEADTIPFSPQHLPFLLKLFNFLQDSPQGKAMEDTLIQCATKPIKGETKICATSLESMLDFVHQIFGPESHFRVLTTTHITKLSKTLQNYTILKVSNEFYAPKMVACHTMPYPYAIYYCHSQESENRAFKVLVESDDNGERVEAVVVCHMDTSQWTKNHVSFKVLKIEPGTPGVCHFFPADNLVWIPTAAVASA